MDHNKLENSSRDGNTTPPYLSSEKLVCRSRSKLEPDMEKQTGSKLGKEYIRAVYCHPVYLTYAEYIMKNAGLDESQAGLRLLGEISITSDLQIVGDNTQVVSP